MAHLTDNASPPEEGLSVGEPPAVPSLPLHHSRRPSPERETPRSSPVASPLSPAPASRPPSPLILPCRSPQLSAARPSRRKLRPRGQSRDAASFLRARACCLPGLAGTKQRSPARSGVATPPPHLTQRRSGMMPPPDRRRRLRHPGDLKGRTPLPRSPDASPRPAPGMTRPGPPPPRVLCSHAPISSRRRVRIMAR